MIRTPKIKPFGGAFVIALGVWENLRYYGE